MPDLMTFARSLIQQNQSVFQSNPNAQPWIDAILNNDSQKGMEIAKNLCESRGISVDDAISQARRFFKM